MPVFFTPFMITRLALMADLSSPISSASAAPVETTPEPVETSAPVETTPEPVVETAAPVEKAVATMKMSKAELQALATKQNVNFFKSWNKTKLVEAINA